MRRPAERTAQSSGKRSERRPLYYTAHACATVKKSCIRMGPQVEYHYFKNDTRTYPPTMFNVMRGLRHRGMRVFNVEPNVRHMHLRHVCDQLLLSASAAGVCGLGACSVRDVRARQREVA